MARVIRLTRDRCCTKSNGRSGNFQQIGPDGIKFSVWVGYGNGNHPGNTRPTRYPYPGGSPNGLCKG